MSPRRNPIIATLALVAMLLRVAIPPGWMPTATPGSFITLCTAAGLQQIAATDGDRDGIPSQPHVPTADGSAHCAFAGGGTAAVPAVGWTLQTAAPGASRLAFVPTPVVAPVRLAGPRLTRAPPA